jgi:hypothetical protein
VTILTDWVLAESEELADFEPILNPSDDNMKQFNKNRRLIQLFEKYKEEDSDVSNICPDFLGTHVGVEFVSKIFIKA